MLRTNLSTRPFYNDGAVRAGLAFVALVAVALTLFNVYEVLRLRAGGRTASETVARNEEQAAGMRAKAADIRRSLDRAKLEAVQVAAREANGLIDRRTFSWTELLNQFQTTLPADVRVASVQPQVDNDGRMLVQISVLSRRVEDLDAFMDTLEQTGMFSGVLSRSDAPDESGALRSELQAYYHPLTANAARTAPAASEVTEAAGNATARAATTPAAPVGGAR